jgi:hypothetical protein
LARDLPAALKRVALQIVDPNGLAVHVDDAEIDGSVVWIWDDHNVQPWSVKADAPVREV